VQATKDAVGYFQDYPITWDRLVEAVDKDIITDEDTAFRYGDMLYKRYRDNLRRRLVMRMAVRQLKNEWDYIFGGLL
jgi:hypothetical protein